MKVRRWKIAANHTWYLLLFFKKNKKILILDFAAIQTWNQSVLMKENIDSRIYHSRRHNLHLTLEIISRNSTTKSTIFKMSQSFPKSSKKIHKVLKLGVYNIKTDLARSTFQLWMNKRNDQKSIIPWSVIVLNDVCKCCKWFYLAIQTLKL